MVELSLALRIKQPEPKITALKRCLMSGLSTLPEERQSIQQCVDLLQRQLLIEVPTSESHDEYTARIAECG